MTTYNKEAASSLLSLPAEIRLQIFQCLFLRSEGIDLQKIADRIKYGLNYDDFDIHTAILRTSHKVYEEASQVLYEENLFRFSYYGGFLRNTNLYSDAIPWKTFKRTKNIRVNFYDITWCPVTAECIATVLQSISRSGCSLKTLGLFINVQEPRSLLDLYHGDRVDGRCELQSIAPKLRQRWLELLDVVLVELVVQQKIEINLATVFEPSINEFGDLLYDIAARIGWKVNLAKINVEEILTEEEEPCYRYKLTWMLQPSTGPSRIQ